MLEDMGADAEANTSRSTSHDIDLAREIRNVGVRVKGVAASEHVDGIDG